MLLAQGTVSEFDEIVIIIVIALPANKFSPGHKLTSTHDLGLVDFLHANFDPQAVVASGNRNSSMSRTT